MPRGRSILSGLVVCLAMLPGAAVPSNAAGPVDAADLVPASAFPGTDPGFRIGKLDNGLTWYVRRNSNPPRRVELRLVVTAGGKQDEPGREGTAHLVEHLLFKGTKRYPGGEVLRYLESLGSQPGADVNATTSHDITCYFLKVPVDTPAHMEQAVAILADFAHAATLPEEEVARERGIVLAEWRQRTDADETARRRHDVVLHADPSRYLSPMGSDASIVRLDRATLQEFYTRWYTPDRMAIIVVGDVDVDSTVSVIQRTFDPIPARAPGDAETEFRTGSTRTDISLVTDAAVSGSRMVLAARVPEPRDARTAYCQAERDRLFQGLLQVRLNRLYAGIRTWPQRLDDSTRVLLVDANVVPGQEIEVTRNVYRELTRVAQHGFDSLLVVRELEAWRMARDRWPELYANRASPEWIDEAVSHFVWGDPILSAADARDLSGRCLEELGPSAGREWAQAFMDSSRRTVMLTVRPIPGEKTPTEAGIASMIGEVSSRRLGLVDDSDRRNPLDLNPGPAGAILHETTLPENGMTILTLSNGVNVWMKPIANGSNEIRIEAISPRGAMAAPKEEYFSALYSNEFAWLGGAGGFAEPGWRTRMNGRAVRWAVETACLESRIDCRTGATDLETAFDSLHHTFLDLPLNVGSYRTLSAFADWQGRLAARIAVGRTEPHVAYRQEFRRLVCDDHPLCGDPNEKQLGSMNVNRGLEFYRSVFGNISPFTLLVVGDFDPGVVRDYAVTYIGSIPARGARSGYAKRCPFTFPPKATRRRLAVGAKEAAQVALILPSGSEGPVRDAWARELACRYLDKRIEGELRERLGAVYGTFVRTAGFVSRDVPPSLWIEFECAPDSVEMLENVALAILSQAPGDSISEARIAELKLGLTVDAEEKQLDSEACLGAMRAALQFNSPPDEVDFSGSGINRITPALLREILRQLIWPERAVSLVVVPEK